jgi:hypothetical protein
MWLSAPRRGSKPASREPVDKAARERYCFPQ